jgi:hypothetical protein
MTMSMKRKQTKKKKKKKKSGRAYDDEELKDPKVRKIQ